MFVDIVHSCQRLLDIFRKVSALYHVLDCFTPHHFFDKTFHIVIIGLQQNCLQLMNTIKKHSVELNPEQRMAI